MRAQRSTLERVSLSAGEIAPEADLSQMMARRWRSSGVADRTAALEIVHGASGNADSSASDGLFFKKGFATAEGFRPSYWVYERESEDQASAKEPIPLQPAHKPQRTPDDAVIPLAAIPNLAAPGDAGESDEDEGAEAAAPLEANSNIEPEADLSKIVIRRTPFIRSADCDPTLGLAIEAATRAALPEPLRPVDLGGVAHHMRQAQTASTPVPIPEPVAPVSAPVAPPPVEVPQSPLNGELPRVAPIEAARAEPAPVAAPPPAEAAKPSPKAAPDARGSVVVELTQVIESVLSSKSYASQQDTAALRTARERPDARQKGGSGAQANARSLSPAATPAPSVAGGRAPTRHGGTRVILAAIWRIGRVSALAILVTLLAEYLLTNWLSGG